MNPKTFTKLTSVIAGTATALFVSHNNYAQAITITQILGDNDFFGFNSGTIGDSVPSVDFNNQLSGDPLFTDRDLRQSLSGPDIDNDIGWTHDLSTELTGKTITGITLQLPIGGIQDANPSLGSLDDRLFIEGIEVLGAFDTVDQGGKGTGLFSFLLTPSQINSFKTDSILDIFIDGGKIPSDASQAVGVLDGYFIDYSQVNVTVETVETVESLESQSIPESSNLFGLILVAGGAVLTKVSRSRSNTIDW